MNEASQLSQSVYFVTTKGGQKQFLGEKAISSLEFERLCCCSCYYLSRTSLLKRPKMEGQELFAFLFWPTKYCIWIHCKAWCNLRQDIYFPQFMNGSNLTDANSNYWLHTHFFVYGIVKLRGKIASQRHSWCILSQHLLTCESVVHSN